MNIKDLCNVSLGHSKYNHAYFKNNLGIYPVYSSQTTNDGIIANITTADYKNKTGITWTKDGIYAGTVFKRINATFSMTTHCGFLEIKPEHINNLRLDYLFLYLSFNLKKEAVGEQNKRVTEQIISQIFIPHYGNLQAQQEYINQYSKICSLIDTAKATIAHIDKIETEKILEKGMSFKKYKISDLIEVGASNAGFLTQKFVNDNKGAIPVYGASEEDKPTYGYIKDNIPKVNYFENCFRYNRNGSFGVFVTKGRFTVSNDVRAFTIQPKYLGLIDPDYLVIKLKEVYYANNLSYGNKAGKDRFLSLEVIIIDLDKYTLADQALIAKRFNRANHLKDKIIKELSTI